MKKVSVILLPTNKPIDGGLALYGEQLQHINRAKMGNKLFEVGIEASGYTNLIPQHQYICSDEEIKEGNWIIDSASNVRKALRDSKKDEFANGMIKKIIATTDTTLNNCDSCGNVGCHLCMGKGLSTIPQNFIDKYISEYNKGNIITEALVEYIEYEGIGGRFPEYDKPKLNNNEIIITSVKDSWNKEELVDILCNFSTHTEENVRIWINQNL